MKKLFTLLFLVFINSNLHAQCWLKVAAGIDHTIAIKPDGTLWAWGFNGYGELGDATLENRSIPIQIGSDSNWKIVSAGGNHSFAIKADGTLWAWGDNFWGQLGIGTFGNNKNVPTQVGSATNWESVSAGRTFSLAIKKDGSLWAWGENIFGQLGNQSSAAFSPTRVGTSSDWKLISAGGNHTVAIKTDGTLWAWGYNSDGELGDGTTINKDTPVKIGSATDWKSVSTGYDHSLAIKNDGTLWVWGNNSLGALGDGTFTNKNVPTKLGVATNWQSISSGNSSSIAIKTDGSLWVWGWIIGKFGFGSENTNVSPVNVGVSQNWQSITSGDYHAFAFETSGALWGLGNNDWGKLGDGTTINQTEPLLLSAAAPTGESVQAICQSGTLADLKLTGSNITWYALPSGESPLPITTSLVDKAHYYASSTKNSCESSNRFDVLVTINNTPTAAPTGLTVQSFCGATSVSALVVDGVDIKWYSSSNGGQALDELTQLINNSTYFASQTIAGCESSLRFGVKVLVNTTPAPTGVGFQTKCNGATFSDIEVAGSSIAWYADKNSTIALPNSSLPASGNYYATQTINGTESCTRLAVQITIVSVPAPTGESNQLICSGKQISSLSANGEYVIWYDSPTGGVIVNSEAPIDGHHYYAAQQLNGCISYNRLDVAVTVNSTLPPVLPIAQFFCTGATLADYKVTGDDIKWYDMSAGGQPLPLNTILENGSTVYASQTINSFESCSRLSIVNFVLPDKKPDGPALQEFCNQGTVAGLETYNSSVKWYADSNGNNVLPLTTPLVNGVSYYASQMIENCESTERLVVQVVINTNITPAPTGEQLQTVCGSSLSHLNANGNLIKWYDSKTNNIPLPPYDNMEDGKHYYATQTVTACESIDRLDVMVKILPIPSSPLQLNPGWRSVSSGFMHTIGVKNDGTLFGWGDNKYMQLGLGTGYSGERISYPILLSKDNDWKTADAGSWHNSAIKNNGSLWVWGLNYVWPNSGMDSHGYLSRYPIQKGNDYDWNAVSTGSDFTILLKTNGTLWTLTNQQYSNVPIVQMGTDSDWVSISAGLDHSLALKADGSLWAWGNNSKGQLGDGTQTSRAIPVKIGSDNDWKQVSAGTMISFAIKQDGSLWTWGSGTSFFNIPFETLSPRRLGTGSDWLTVAAGTYGSVIIKTNGSMWSLPFDKLSTFGVEQVGNSLEWQTLAIGPDFSIAIKSNGTVWSWGNDAYRQLGLDYSSGSLTVPSQVESPDVFFKDLCSSPKLSDLTINGQDIKWYTERYRFQGSYVDPATILVDGHHYYATQTVSTCESWPYAKLDVLVIDVNNIPPSGLTDQYFCKNAKVADLKAEGQDIKWYDTPSSELPLTPSTILIDGLHYYGAQTAGACESKSRLDVKVTLSETEAPTGSTHQAVCFGASIDDLSAVGNDLQWYTEPTGGNPLSSFLALVDGNHYYATQTKNSCESKERFDVEVNLSTVMAPTASTAQTFCEGATVNQLSIVGNEIKWYDAPLGGNALSSSITLSNSNTYFATQTVSGCESSTRLGVAVTVNPLPSSPTGSSSQSFESNKTISDLIVSGSDIKWYRTISDVFYHVNSLPSSEMLINAGTYYATQTVSGCESQTAFAVNVSIITGIELNKELFEFYPNPVTDYLRISGNHIIDKITIVNLLGQRLITKEIKSQEAQVDLSALEGGVYLIHMEIKGKVVLRKVAKK